MTRRRTNNPHVPNIAHCSHSSGSRDLPCRAAHPRADFGAFGLLYFGIFGFVDFWVCGSPHGFSDFGISGFRLLDFWIYGLMWVFGSPHGFLSFSLRISVFRHFWTFTDCPNAAVDQRQSSRTCDDARALARWDFRLREETKQKTEQLKTKERITLATVP